MPDAGIDFDKPWEFSKMEGYTIIEYFFSGTIEEESVFIDHPHYGINISKAAWISEEYFGTKDILSLAVVTNDT